MSEQQVLTPKQDYVKTDSMDSNRGIQKAIILHYMIGVVYYCTGNCFLLQINNDK